MGKIHDIVRKSYTVVATEGCGCSASGCCAPAPRDNQTVSQDLGYSVAQLASLPGGANLGLGCGNPQAIASLKPGETVVDLGSGAGIDCFLAAEQVGATGYVIGVDMTAAMLERARANAVEGGYDNVEFRLGEIEHVPVADGTVDVIVSNCVVNLSPDKAAVYRDAFRVLRSGGRIALSDVIARAPIPEVMRADEELLSGCISGAETAEVVLELLTAAGFVDIRVEPKDGSAAFIKDWIPGEDLSAWVVSADIQAVKP